MTAMLSIGLLALSVAAEEPAAPPDIQSLVEQIGARLVQFDRLVNFRVATEDSSARGFRHREFARREDGLSIDIREQGWQLERRTDRLGPNGTIRVWDRGWLKTIYRDAYEDRPAFCYMQVPPEPGYQLRILLGWPHSLRPDGVASGLLTKNASVKVLPPTVIGQDSCIGVESLTPTRWKDKPAELRYCYWFIPDRGMALKRHESGLVSENYTQNCTWEMSEFIEIADGLWMATRATVKEPDAEYEVRVTDWSVDRADLTDEMFSLEFEEGVEVQDNILNEPVPWRKGWTVPEMILGKKGCGRGIRLDDFVLHEKRVEPLAEKLVEALPAAADETWRVCMYGPHRDLAARFYALASARKRVVVPDADGSLAAGKPQITFTCVLAPIDQRHLLVHFSQSSVYEASNWATLYEWNPFRGEWRIARQGRKATVCSDPARTGIPPK